MTCSFCGKSQHELAVLIIGPDVNICDECLAVCIGIVLKNLAKINKENERLENFIHLQEIN